MVASLSPTVLTYEDAIYNGNYQKALPYLDIYNFIETVLHTNASDIVLKTDSDTFYSKLNEQLKENTQVGTTGSGGLLNKPIVYGGYFDGWQQISCMMKLLVFMETMFIAICLSTVFIIEHTRKTDQLILCSRYGKKKLYLAKLFVGLTVGLGFALLLSILFLGIIDFLYGLDGFDVILQFVLLRPFALFVGQAVIILFACRLRVLCY